MYNQSNIIYRLQKYIGWFYAVHILKIKKKHYLPWNKLKNLIEIVIINVYKN